MDPKTSTTKPLLWLVGLFVLAGLIGLAAYTYSQRSGGGAGNANMPANANTTVNTSVTTNTNRTTNANSPAATEWQKYRSAAKGFTIQYPNSWESLERPDGSIVFAPEGRFGEFPDLSVSAMSKGSTSFELVKKSNEEIPLTDRVEKERMVNGITVYHVSGTSTTPLTDGTYRQIDRAVLEAGAFVYELSGNNAREYFERMLQSFNRY